MIHRPHDCPISRQVFRLIALAGLLSLASAGCNQSIERQAAKLRVGRPGTATWSPKIDLPLVPAAAAHLPDGKVLLWSSTTRTSFGGGGETYTAILNPATRTSTESLVSVTGHDMFCPGTTNLADGRILVNGGVDSGKTSIYNPVSGAWVAAAAMSIPRGYNANTLLADGSVFTLGGSWSGGTGNKHGEVWTESGGWRRLSGVSVSSMVTDDPGGIFRADNHMWLIPTGNGRVLHAGPHSKMTWIDTRGDGATASAGDRGDDTDSMCGNTVMYDAGKILKVGGSTAYQDVEANASAFLIDTNGGISVRRLAPMAYARAFHNSVVLPNGQVVVIGGQTRPVPFSDDRSVLVAELWDPTTETFSSLPPMSIPRNYHSIALLLPDGTVLAAGGGLCGGCTTNHADAQILTPPYLLNENGSAASRPVITTAPSQASYGASMAVTTNAAVAAFALVRMGSNTHSVNNDQRRISLSFQSTGASTYTVAAPTNPGIALPGAYMLFALDADGVPSVAWTVRIGGSATPHLTILSDQTGNEGQAVSLTVVATASDAGGAITYAAGGLPPGLTVAPTTGVVSGIPTTAGTFLVTALASNVSGTESTDFVWKIFASGDPRFVKLEELSEVNGLTDASVAEFNILDANGNAMSRVGFLASADSAQSQDEDHSAGKAIDGLTTTMWHTEWYPGGSPPPHSLVVDMGTRRTVGGFRYLPRQGGSVNGTIARFRFYVSTNGTDWGSPVAEGDFSSMGATTAEKTVLLSVSPTNRPPSVTTPVAQNTELAQAVSLPVVATDPDGDTLSFSAMGLPTGLAINASSGVISGTPTTGGVFSVTVVVQDNKAASTSIGFSWTVLATPPPSSGLRFVKLEQLSEINGQAWGSMAEFNVLDPNGNPIARSGFRVSTDSQELFGESGAASNAIDGQVTTHWHTEWSQGSPPPPHSFVVDMGGTPALGGFRYLPRQDGGRNGTIARFRFYVSANGIDWGNPIAEGDFSTMGPTAAAKTVRFNITPTNSAPSVTAPGAQSTVVGQTVSLPVMATDPDGDVLAFSAMGLPPGLGINAASGVISGTATTTGLFSVTVVVQDDEAASSSISLNWTVTALPPANRAPSVTALGAQSSVVGQTVSLPVIATDPDGDVLAFSAMGLPPGLGINAASGVISGTPTTTGLFSVTVVVQDDEAASSSISLDWTVTAPPPPANRPPSVTTPGAQSTELAQAVSLPVVATDPDGDTLSFSATGLPTGLAINAISGVIAGTPNTGGIFSVTVVVQDSKAASTSITFSWTVLATPPPSTGPRFVKLEQLSEINGQAWGSMSEFNVLDPNGNPIARSGFRVSTDSQELFEENGAASNAIDGQVTTHWHTEWSQVSPPLPHSFVVDLGGTPTLGGFRYLPRQDGGRNGTIARFRFYVSANGIDWGNPIAEGDFSTMGPTTAAKTVRFNITPTNSAPSVTALGAQSTVVGQTVSLPVIATDPDGDVLTFSAMGLPPGLGINAASGVISGTPTTTGLFSVTVVVQDDKAVSSSISLNWTVTAPPPANRAPSVTALGAQSTVVGQTVSLPVIATDPDGDVLTFSAMGLPPGLGINAASGVISGTPTTTGLFSVTVVVQDDEAASTSISLNWTVTAAPPPANRAPSVTTPAAQSTVVGQTVSLPVIATDPDGDVLTFSAMGLPPGLGINAASGVISGTATTAGLFSVTVVVQDDKAASSSISLNWTVTAPPPPVPTVIAPVLAPPILVGSMASYVPDVTGVGLTFSWDFGDGSATTPFASAAPATHVFATAGLFSVTLTAKASDGQATTRTFTQAVVTTGNSGGSVSSSSIVMESKTGNGRALWVVNPDNNSVSGFDIATQMKVAEIAVGAGPATLAVAGDGKIWVANREAGSLSVIDPTTRAVVATLAMPRGSQPFGIVFSPTDGAPYVTLDGTGRLLKLNAQGSVVGSLDVGPRPRDLTIDATGARILVSRFITPPLPGEGTALVQTVVGGAPRGGEVVVVNTASFAVQTTIVLRHSDAPDSTVQGRGVPNYLGAAVISPDGASAWVPSKQDNILRGTLRDGRNLDFQNTVRAITSRINLTGLTEDYPARVDHDNAGVATAAAFHPTGAYLFVALETSRQVAVLDPVARREFLRFDVGRAPQGLAVTPDGLRLLVSNFMDRTVGVFDLAPLMNYGESRMPPLGTLSAVGVERLTAAVLVGKQLFYDARDGRLARDGYLSCASCHRDAQDDGRTWDLTGLGEGLRNTISLRGRAGGQGPLHWSGNFDEVQDFEGQIRGLAQGTGLMSNADFMSGTRNTPLGDKKAGLSPDLDALAAYLGSLSTFALSPARNADGTPTAEAVAGKSLFVAQCASCHGGESFTGSAVGNLLDVGTLKPSSGTRLGSVLTGIDLPTLRDAWATAPYLHDGSAATLSDAIRAHTSLALTDPQVGQLASFVRQIGSEEPDPSPAIGGVRARYVKLEQLSEIGGNAWGSMAEFNLVDAAGNNLSRQGWVASTDSQELAAENGSVANAIDGQVGTIWHTEWDRISPAPPHYIVVDLQTTTTLGGFRYLPRQSGSANGTIARFRFFVSNDGVTWGAPLVDGDFATMGPVRSEKTVILQ